jgi:hypothetical protein
MTLYRLLYQGRRWGQIEAESQADAIAKFVGCYPRELAPKLERLTAEPVGK